LVWCTRYWWGDDATSGSETYTHSSPGVNSPLMAWTYSCLPSDHDTGDR
jgi:hypothetical protein